MFIKDFRWLSSHSSKPTKKQVTPFWNSATTYPSNFSNQKLSSALWDLPITKYKLRLFSVIAKINDNHKARTFKSIPLLIIDWIYEFYHLVQTFASV